MKEIDAVNDIMSLRNAELTPPEEKFYLRHRSQLKHFILQARKKMNKASNKTYRMTYWWHSGKSVLDIAHRILDWPTWAIVAIVALDQLVILLALVGCLCSGWPMAAFVMAFFWFIGTLACVLQIRSFIQNHVTYDELLRDGLTTRVLRYAVKSVLGETDAAEFERHWILQTGRVEDEEGEGPQSGYLLFLRYPYSCLKV